MTNNMTIGPALAIGGNKVEMTQKGKIKVTNPQGKVKTLSQDEFKKQLLKNADNIQAGKDFEFKKDNKNAKAAVGIGGLLAAAYIGLSVAVGKKALTKAVPKAGEKLGFMGNVKNIFVAIGESGVKLWNSVAGKAAKVKDKITGNKKADTVNRTMFDGERTANATMDNLDARLTSKETAQIKNSTIAKMADEDAKAFEARAKEVAASHKSVQAEVKSAFKDYDPVKFKKEQVLKEAGVTEKQYKARKVADEKLAKIDEQFAAIDKQFAEIDKKYPQK